MQKPVFSQRAQFVHGINVFKKKIIIIIVITATVNEFQIRLTCLCNVQRYFMAVKIIFLDETKSDSFLNFAKNTDCEYTLEPAY